MERISKIVVTNRTNLDNYEFNIEDILNACLDIEIVIDGKDYKFRNLAIVTDDINSEELKEQLEKIYLHNCKSELLKMAPPYYLIYSRNNRLIVELIGLYSVNGNDIPSKFIVPNFVNSIHIREMVLRNGVNSEDIFYNNLLHKLWEVEIPKGVDLYFERGIGASVIQNSITDISYVRSLAGKYLNEKSELTFYNLCEVDKDFEYLNFRKNNKLEKIYLADTCNIEEIPINLINVPNLKELRLCKSIKNIPNNVKLDKILGLPKRILASAESGLVGKEISINWQPYLILDEKEVRNKGQ